MAKRKVTRLEDGQFRVKVNARETFVQVEEWDADAEEWCTVCHIDTDSSESRGLDRFHAFDLRVIEGLRYAADALAVYDEDEAGA